VSASDSNGSGEGLSLETLLIAAIASAVAAVVVSKFWQGGTPIAAAITPVVVSLVSEGLRRPMRSERLRSTTRRAVDPLRRSSSGSVPVQRKVGEEELGYTVYGSEGEARTTGGERSLGSRSRDLLERVRAGLTPKRTRIALVTGLLAFVAAAAVLTLPELLFGGSVSGDRDTTLFGGGGKDEERNGKQDRDGGGSGDGRDGGSEDSPGSPPSGGDQPEETQPPPSEPPPEEEQPPPSPAPQPPSEPQPLP
jgi:hypothetical protein